MNLIPNGNFADATGWTEHDCNMLLGRLSFNAPDGGDLADINVTGLTEGERYVLEWMQEVTPGDSVAVFGMSGPDGHGRSGHACVEFVAGSTSQSVQFRGYGTNGTGWIDGIRLSAA